MARISIEDCLDKVDNRFALVIAAANRAKKLLKGDEPLLKCDNKENVTALREIAKGLVDVKLGTPEEDESSEK